MGKPVSLENLFDYLADAAKLLEGAEVTVHACRVVREPPYEKTLREAREVIRKEDPEAFAGREKFFEPPDRYVAIEMTVVPRVNLVESSSKFARKSSISTWEPWGISLFRPDEDPAQRHREIEAARAAGTEIEPERKPYIARIERLTDDGSKVRFDTDKGVEAGQQRIEKCFIKGAARIRITWALVGGLTGEVRLHFYTHDLTRVTLPPLQDRGEMPGD